MSSFRITQRAVSRTMMDGLQANLGRMQKLQEQLSSGKQVSRPSDSPVKTSEAMQFRSEIRRTEQYVRNAEDGLAWLGTADSVLTTSLDMAQRARDLVLQGINDTSNPQARLAIAEELDTLRDGLIGVGNTRYLNRPLFGGNSSVPDAYTVKDLAAVPPVAGGEYVGDSGKVTRTIAAGTMVDVNVSGEDVFGDSTQESQLFNVLATLRDALKVDPVDHAVLNDGLKNLDTAIDRVVTTLGQIGARFNRVETMRTTAEDQLISLGSSLSEVEDIDLPKTIIDLQMQEVAYKAALGATARVVQPSLLDFLR